MHEIIEHGDVFLQFTARGMPRCLQQSWAHLTPEYGVATLLEGSEMLFQASFMSKIGHMFSFSCYSNKIQQKLSMTEHVYDSKH